MITKTFTPEKSQVVAKPEDGAQFLYIGLDRRLMLGEAQTCDCGAQCHVNSGAVLASTPLAALRSIPFVAGPVAEIWATDSGDYGCETCGKT